MRIYLLIILIFFLGLSIKAQNEQFDDYEFNTIMIQFLPTFHEPSQILLNNKSHELTFYRIGPKKYLLPPSAPSDSLKQGYNPNITVKKRPKCSYYSLTDKEAQYLNDSILLSFSEKEMKDSTVQTNDGIFISLFITFKGNNKVKEIELSNASSSVHENLFNYLTDLTIKNSSDTLTKKYLKRLKKYWD